VTAPPRMVAVLSECWTMTSPRDLRALASLPEPMAQGFTTFCLKPSQFTDDAGAAGALFRDVVARVAAL
jgi:hypothetical protein